MDLRMTEHPGAWFGFEVAGLGRYNPSGTDRRSLAEGRTKRRGRPPGADAPATSKSRAQRRCKIAIVTASSRGIGRATAEILAAEGARITICARTAAAVTSAAEQIRGRTGADVLALEADVTRAEDIERIVARTVEAYGTVNILVNNAGGPPPGTFDTLGDSEWQAGFELTLLSVIRMTRAVLPHMRRAGGGAIVNLQSTSVKAPIDNLMLSNAIRTGVIGLAKSLSFELAKDGIRVNNVLPGAIMTDRQREMLALQSTRSGKSVEELVRLKEAAIPLGRLGEPEDLGNMIVFLVSERARYVTGVTVQVDGGMVRSLM
jgi:3-oxoacyl-[acyl-carrier protein] reductase